MSQSDAILEFTISVNAKASEETKKLLEDLQEAKKLHEDSTEHTVKEEKPKTTASPKEGIEAQGTLNNFTKDKFFEDPLNEFNQKQQLNKDVLDTLNKLDSKGLANLSSFASNPTATTFNALTSVLSMAGPEGTAFVAIIGLAISSPEVIKKIVDVLSQKGGPLNRDYQIVIQDQIKVGLSRLLQKRTELGLDQVILTQQKGFTPANLAWSYNSYLKLDETRVARIGLTDRAAGVITN